MKIAVAYENGQIFQHFGHTEQFKLCLLYTSLLCIKSEYSDKE